MPTPVLIIPGYDNSGPKHWQSLWEAHWPHARRVQQRDWLAPEPDEWAAALDAEVARCSEPPVLVAHSCGVLTVVHWARTAGRPVKGALLVAPSDPEKDDMIAPVRVFAPLPREPLPFPSVVVASSNDPYADLAWSRACAQAWGSRLVDVGPRGHVNSASGLGNWPEGLALLAPLS